MDWKELIEETKAKLWRMNNEKDIDEFMEFVNDIWWDTDLDAAMQSQTDKKRCLSSPTPLSLLEKKLTLGTSTWKSRNSHIADKLLSIREEQFVTGKISHIEHKTLKLQGWFKVVRNNEARTSAISGTQIVNGVKFVD